MWWPPVELIMDPSERIFKRCNIITSMILAITSIIILVTSTLLVTKFFVTHWGSWSDYKVIGPYLMVILSIYQLFISIIGFINGLLENRCTHVSFVILLVVAFITQIGVLITCIKLNCQINSGYIFSIKPIAEEEIRNYGYDLSTQAFWDNLQRQLHCCGVEGKQDGYKFWFTYNTSVPNSCCREDQFQCGESINKDISLENAGKSIYTEGCLDKLELEMNEIVRPLIVMCQIVGALNLIVELICIVLISVYAMQMSKRGQKALIMKKVIDYNRKTSERVDEGTPMKGIND